MVDRRNHRTGAPGFERGFEERLVVSRQVPRLRVVEQLLQLQVVDRLAALVGEGDQVVGHFVDGEFRAHEGTPGGGTHVQFWSKLMGRSREIKRFCLTGREEATVRTAATGR